MNELESLKNFWKSIALELHWEKPFSETLNYDFKEGLIQWFSDGEISVIKNCLQIHAENNPNQPAIIFEPNSKEEGKVLSYQALYLEVQKFASILREAGVKKGERVCIYMPMIPEAIISCLACAYIGAIHVVVFAGFSANALAERINDAGAKIIITADVLLRGEKALNLLAFALEASLNAPLLQTAIILRRNQEELPSSHLKIISFEDEMKKERLLFECEKTSAEDGLFVLYTSGSTSKPKGIFHTIGGYLVSAYYSFKNVFGFQKGEVFFCTADIGWITGHTYQLYGAFLNGATSVIYEGIPTFPNASRLWEIVEKHSVNILYTAPTAIRSLMSFGEDFVKGFEMPSLRVLGSVGEPINEEAWKWYFKNVGKGRCEIVDTWWQTETGSIMISAMAGKTKSPPTFAGSPLPFVFPILLDEEGSEVLESEKVGNLCFKYPVPSIARGIWGDEEKFKKTYFEKFAGFYFSGDGAFKTKDGIFRITGRVDDVINVSGHRFGTAEIENIVNIHKNVLESAVIGFPHEIKGEGIAVFAVFKGEDKEKAMLEIKHLITIQIGAIARPDKIFLVDDLPKTRSGKIMRRILKKMVKNELDYGDVSTLVNPHCVKNLEVLFFAK
jgi:acetyl-CoA synthetase